MKSVMASMLSIVSEHKGLRHVKIGRLPGGDCVKNRACSLPSVRDLHSAIKGQVKLDLATHPLFVNA